MMLPIDVQWVSKYGSNPRPPLVWLGRTRPVRMLRIWRFYILLGEKARSAKEARADDEFEERLKRHMGKGL